MKKKKNYKQFSCKMDTNMLEQVKKTVLDYDIESINVFINDCIRYALKNMKIKEK